MKKFIIAITAIVASVSMQAQDCAGYHKKASCSQASEAGFMYNSQSKSGVFAPGTSSNMKVVFYSGFDYSISICPDKLLGTDLSFKMVDSKTGEVLYDNATDSKSTHMEFSCETTRAVTIQVTVPGAKIKKGQSVDGACLGVLIEQKPTPKVGF